MDYEKIMNQYSDLINKNKLKMQYYMKPNIFASPQNINQIISNNKSHNYNSNHNNNTQMKIIQYRKLSPQSILNIHIKPQKQILNQHNQNPFASKIVEQKNLSLKLPSLISPKEQDIEISRVKQQYGYQLKKQIQDKNLSKKALKMKELIQNKYFVNNNYDYFRFGEESKLLSKRTLEILQSQQLQNSKIIEKFKLIDQNKSNQKSRVLKRFYQQTMTKQKQIKQKFKQSLDTSNIFIPLTTINQKNEYIQTKYQNYDSRNKKWLNNFANQYVQTQQILKQNPQQISKSQHQKQYIERKNKTHKRLRKMKTLNHQDDEQEKFKQIKNLIKQVELQLKENKKMMKSQFEQVIYNQDNKFNQSDQGRINLNKVQKKIIRVKTESQKNDSKIERLLNRAYEQEQKQKQKKEKKIIYKKPKFKLNLQKKDVPIMTKQRKKYLIQNGLLQQFAQQLQKNTHRLKQLNYQPIL